jgi:thiamine biosynthesis protein ThiS
VEQTLAEMPTVVVIVNGARHDLPVGCDVAALLARLALDPRKVAVERNEAIVPRSRYAATILQPGDTLEVVHFIGGG